MIQKYDCLSLKFDKLLVASSTSHSWLRNFQNAAIEHKLERGEVCTS